MFRTPFSFFLLTAAALAQAQGSAPADPLQAMLTEAHHPRLDLQCKKTRSSICVADVDEAVTFYQDALPLFSGQSVIRSYPLGLIARKVRVRGAAGNH